MEKINSQIEELKEWNIIDDFNKFILKWCKENYIEHLLDTDENDGEYLRDKLRELQKGKQEAQSQFLKRIDEWYKGWKKNKIQEFWIDDLKELKSQLTGDEK